MRPARLHTAPRRARRHKRYVMEDRWMAIRWAVGTARENDCVVIAGKGAEDFQEHWETGGFDEDGEFFEWEDENGELDDSVGEMIKVRGVKGRGGASCELGCAAHASQGDMSLRHTHVGLESGAG